MIHYVWGVQASSRPCFLHFRQGLVRHVAAPRLGLLLNCMVAPNPNEQQLVMHRCETHCLNPSPRERRERKREGGGRASLPGSTGNNHHKKAKPHTWNHECSAYFLYIWVLGRDSLVLAVLIMGGEGGPQEVWVFSQVSFARKLRPSLLTIFSQCVLSTGIQD